MNSSRKTAVSLLMAGGLLACMQLPGGSAAPIMYLSIQTTGPQTAGPTNVTGTGQGPNHQDEIEVLGFEWHMKAPRDLATGQSSGKRQHGTLKIIKAIDVSSPKLHALMVSNAGLTATLKLWRPGASGGEVNFYTLKLTDVAMTEILQGAGAMSTAATYPPEERETIDMAVDKAEEIWPEGGNTMLRVIPQIKR